MLVDTESWYFDATKRALEGVGVTLMMDQYLDFMARGQSAWDLACIIHEQATAAADSSKTPGLAGGRALRVLGSLQGKLQSNSQASCHVLPMHAPVPMGRDPRPPVRAPCLRGPALYYSGSLLANCPRPDLATLLHE